MNLFIKKKIILQIKYLIIFLFEIKKEFALCAEKIVEMTHTAILMNKDLVTENFGRKRK
jgi:hypothetical protein